MCVPRMPVECQEQPFVQHDSNATVTMRLFSVSILYLLNPGVALYSELLVCNSSHDDGKYYMSILENCGLPKPQTLNFEDFFFTNGTTINVVISVTDSVCLAHADRKLPVWWQ